jgi:glycosyltransferase involved in cell wall biosynthesis
MKFLILGNMANDGYSVAKELRKMGESVDLAINLSDFGMALPEWEDGDFNKEIDPYKIKTEDLENSWQRPNWIIYFDFKNNLGKKYFLKKIKARIELLRMIRKYDVIEAHVPFSIYTQFSGRAYAVYEAGWIRYFPFQGGFRNKLAKRGYQKAKMIIMTNPDTFQISDNLKYLDQKNICFIPFAIDPEKYKPKPNPVFREKFLKQNEFLMFSPSRQIWKEKGNDKMIRAFGEFVKKYPNAKLIMVAWSVDEIKSKNLVKELKLENNVIWIKPVPKNELIEYYNASDIVLDQFTLGSWGTSTPEAMSCGKPVLMFYKKEYILRAFGEEPPILNSFTEDEILKNMLLLASDKKNREKFGSEGRKWIIKTHSPRIVAEKHLEVLNSIK